MADMGGSDDMWATYKWHMTIGGSKSHTYSVQDSLQGRARWITLRKLCEGMSCFCWGYGWVIDGYN